MDSLTVSADVIARAAKIKLVLMDVDGVLTDGRIYYFPGPSFNTVEFKGFNSQDGAGLLFLHHCGFKTGVISGRDSPAVTERARLLGITYVYQGFLEKVASYEEILAKENLVDEQVAFIGDDFPDFPLMKRAGLGIAVGDARPELKELADFSTQARGGHGAVREVAELVLKANNQWQKILDKYGLSSK